MGRYYSGDIEGKFWFGVQNSNAADRFGVTGVEPSELYYYFDKENLETVEAEIEVIEKNLGKYLHLMDRFFAKYEYYTDEQLATALGISTSEIETLLGEYADLRLGRKIRKCILENEQCEFTAEC